MMNGLVSYESSDEEDAGQDSLVASGTSTFNGAVEKDAAPAKRLELNDGNPDAPMVGPSMPTDLEASQQHSESPDHSEEVATDPYLANLSEHDLLRHLTQASHPMTALPPSPPGSPNPAIEARFKNFLMLKSKGLHFNEDLAKKSSFRNPALLHTLMTRAGIDDQAQYSSSLPTAVWDPAALPSYAYKEELAKSQQSIRDSEYARKRNESKAGKRTIDFHPAATSAPSSQHSTPGSRQKQARP